MSLREYQQRARVAALCAWTEVDSQMIVMATGLGKTVLVASLAGDWKDNRTLVMVPDIKLVKQTAKKIHKWTGDMPAIEQGKKWANESIWGRSRFVVASTPTLMSQRRFERFEDIGLVIVDECDEGMTESRNRIVRHFIDNYEAKCLGVTASPIRSDGIAMANSFDCCSFNYGIAEATADGWLAPALVTCLQLESLDLSHVKLNDEGEFNQNDLQALLETDKVVFEIAQAVAQESGTLKTVVFCGRVKGARAVSEYLVDRFGLKAAWVCGDERLCSTSHRNEVIKSLMRDPAGVQIVCNVGVLGRGWDYPGLEHIVNACPTMSLRKLTQIFGRGTRPEDLGDRSVVDFEGSTPESRLAAIANSAKPHFKFTDLRDTVLRHKLVSPVDVLAGRMGLPWSEPAKRKLINGQPFYLNRVVDEAKREAELEQLRREREGRARIDSSAKFNRVEVDPFNPYDIAGTGKEKKEAAQRVLDPPTDKQLKYLRWKGIETRGLEISKKQAGRMITQFTKGATLEEVKRTNRLTRPKSNQSARPDVPTDDVNRMLLEM